MWWAVWLKSLQPIASPNVQSNPITIVPDNWIILNYGHWISLIFQWLEEKDAGRMGMLWCEEVGIGVAKMQCSSFMMKISDNNWNIWVRPKVEETRRARYTKEKGTMCSGHGKEDVLDELQCPRNVMRCEKCSSFRRVRKIVIPVLNPNISEKVMTKFWRIVEGRKKCQSLFPQLRNEFKQSTNYQV